MIQAVSWVALCAGFAGMLMLPRTRHGWLVSIGACLLWIVVDIALYIPAGIVGGVVGIAINLHCWHRRVMGADAAD